MVTETETKPQLKKTLSYGRNEDMENDFIELFADGMNWNEIAQAYEEEHPSVIAESIDIVAGILEYLEGHPEVVKRANEKRRKVVKELRSDARRKRDTSWAGESTSVGEMSDKTVTTYNHKGYEDSQKRLLDPFCRGQHTRDVRSGKRQGLNTVIQLTEIEVSEEELES